MTREQAMRLRAIVEQAAASLDDQTASEGAALFPRLKQDGSLIKAGTRINWGGAVKRAAVDLWDRAENSPDAAPALWSDIDYRDGVRIIPETISAADAFANGELGWWDGHVYKSGMNGNVWTPGTQGAMWELVR